MLYLAPRLDDIRVRVKHSYSDVLQPRGQKSSLCRKLYIPYKPSHCGPEYPVAHVQSNVELLVAVHVPLLRHAGPSQIKSEIKQY